MDPNGMEMGTNNNPSKPVQLEKSQYWCSIAYYEISSRIGEIYHARSNNIRVDGYTDPAKDTNRYAKTFETIVGE